MQLLLIEVWAAVGFIQAEVLESWVQADLQPDLTVYLDLDPAVAELRIADREKDRMEAEQRAFSYAYEKVTWRERQDMTAFRRWMHLSLWHRLGNRLSVASTTSLHVALANGSLPLARRCSILTVRLVG